MSLKLVSWFIILARANGASAASLEKCIANVAESEAFGIRFFKMQCESYEDCPDFWSCDPAFGICFISSSKEYVQVKFNGDYAIYNAPNVQTGKFKCSNSNESGCNCPRGTYCPLPLYDGMNETLYCDEPPASAGGEPVTFASAVAGVGGPIKASIDCNGCFSGITGECYPRRCVTRRIRRRRVEVCKCVNTWSCTGEKQESSQWRALLDCRENLNLAITPPDETSNQWRTAVLDPKNHYQQWRQDSEGNLINRGTGKAWTWDPYSSDHVFVDNPWSASSWSFNDKECIRSSQEPKPSEISQKLMAGEWFRFQCLNTANRYSISGSPLMMYDCKTIHPVNGCFKFGNTTN